MEKFYIYIYCNPTKPGCFRYKDFKLDFEPFYVGKGCGNRIKVSLCPSNKNVLKNKIIDLIKKQTGHLPITIFAYQNLNEQEAYEKEVDLIKFFGKLSDGSGTLCNIADGGKGSKGVVRSEDSKEKYRLSSKSKILYGKPVFQYSLDGDFIKKYQSTGEAAKENRIKQSEISKVCRIGGTRYGYQWFYQDFGLKVEKVISNNRKNTFKPILRTSIDKLSGKYYSSITEASLDNNIPINTLSRHCDNGKAIKNFIFTKIKSDAE